MEHKYVGECKLAAKFFSNEILQMEMQICGVLSHEYREYIDAKIKYYKLATYALEVIINNADDNYE